MVGTTKDKDEKKNDNRKLPKVLDDIKQDQKKKILELYNKINKIITNSNATVELMESDRVLAMFLSMNFYMEYYLTVSKYNKNPNFKEMEEDLNSVIKKFNDKVNNLSLHLKQTK